MGQKTSPISNRISLTGKWRSLWFADDKKTYRNYLIADLRIRDFIKKFLGDADIGEIEIIRSRDRIDIKVTTSKPGLVIGRGGQGINLLKENIQKIFYPQGVPSIRLDIIEEKNPDLVASIVAQSIGKQIEKRVSYRRASKQAIEKTMTAKAKGIKIIISGRLNGAEIARDEKFQEGSLPLSRFKEDIDFAVYNTKTTYGIIGVKVWINKGEAEESSE